jgi:hypothetical protein
MTFNGHKRVRALEKIEKAPTPSRSRLGNILTNGERKRLVRLIFSRALRELGAVGRLLQQSDSRLPSMIEG